MKLSNLIRNGLFNSKGSGSRTGIKIGGCSVKQLYFRDADEAWFKDTAGRFWYYSFSEKALTELVIRQSQEQESIPAEAWEAFGDLIGLIILRQKQETINSQQKIDQGHFQGAVPDTG